MWKKNKVLSKQESKDYLNFVNKANKHRSNIYTLNLRHILRKEVKLR